MPDRPFHLLSDYELRHLIAHLYATSRADDIADLLFDPGWIAAQLQIAQIGDVLRDCDYLPHSADSLALRETLRLSAHALEQDPTQLLAQLRGRLSTEAPSQKLAGMLQPTPAALPAVLHPVLSGLYSPGERLLLTFWKHGGAVRALALTKDNTRVLSACLMDNSPYRGLILWDLYSGQEIRRLSGHSDVVLDMAMLPDGRRAISVSADSTLCIWDLNDGSLLRRLTGQSSAIRAVDVTADGRYAVSGADDGTVAVWDLRAMVLTNIFMPHSKKIMSVCTTPNGMHVISASFDYSINISSLPTGHVFKSAKQAHNGAIQALALNAEGTLLASASDDKTIKIWGITNNRQTTLRRRSTCKGHRDYVLSVAFAGDGQTIVSGSDDCTIRIWNSYTGEEIGRIDGHSRGISRVAITRDRGQVLSASHDGAVRVWRLESQARMEPLSEKYLDERRFQQRNSSISRDSAVNAIAFTPDSRFAIVAFAGQELVAWPLDDDASPFSLDRPSRYVKCLHVSRNNCLIGISNGGMISTWQIDEYRFTKQRDLKLEGIPFGGLRALCITNDGSSVAGQLAWHVFDGIEEWERNEPEANAIGIWNAQTGQRSATLIAHEEPVASIVASSDGSWLVSISNDGEARLWCCQSSAVFSQLAMMDCRVSNVAISRNGDFLVASIMDALTIRQLPSTREIRRLRIASGTEGRIRYLRICEGDRMILYIAQNRLFLASLLDGAVVARYSADAEITRCDISRDQNWIVAGDALGRVHILRCQHLQ